MASIYMNSVSAAHVWKFLLEHFPSKAGVCQAKGKLTKSKYTPRFFSGKVKTYFFPGYYKSPSFKTTTKATLQLNTSWAM